MIIAILVLAQSALAAEPQTAELRGDRWVEVNAPTTAPAADPELSNIEQLVQRKRNSEAIRRLVKWFKSHPPTDPMRDRALYLMAEALYQRGNRIKSFYYCDELMDEHPDSPLFYPTLELQYKIADAYLDGYRRRFLLIPMFHAYDEGVDMLFRIRNRSPGSPLAEKALLRTADFYYADGQFDLAADAYSWYAREYPRSPAIARVKLRQAFSNYAQFRGLRFDATPLVEARAQLGELIAANLELAEEESLPAVIERIDRTFAEKLYVTAEFYRRTKEPRAAVYTYRYLLDAYPNTPEAAKARRAMERMPQWALESPPPARPAPEPRIQPISSIER